MPVTRSRSALGAVAAWAAVMSASGAVAQPHNLIIFVADGLRSEIVTPNTAPALAEVRDKGVDLANSHSMFPTLTTVNAASIATGHRPGDTGDVGNVLWVGKNFDPPYASAIAALAA